MSPPAPRQGSVAALLAAFKGLNLDKMSVSSRFSSSSLSFVKTKKKSLLSAVHGPLEGRVTLQVDRREVGDGASLGCSTYHGFNYSLPVPQAARLPVHEGLALALASPQAGNRSRLPASY